jgi:tetratricopeptide (TPR) repeat protein
MHIFARYDDGKVERNIECTNLGVEIPDYGYMMQSKMSFKQAIQGRYFRPVSKKIVLGDLLNAISWCSATGSAKNRLPPKRAVAYARACCVIDPNKYNNWDTLAEAYYYAGDFDQAVQMMDKTMSMDPPYTPPFDKAYYEKQRKKYADAQAGGKPEKAPEKAPDKK